MVEPTDFPQGWYHVRCSYAEGHKPAVVDLAELANILPHGSGIDGDWYISVQRNGDLTVTGEYHAMNEHGYYCGWRTFRFTLRRARKNVYHPLTGPSIGKFQVTKIKGQVYLESFRGGGDAADYLYDTVSHALSEIGIHSMSSHVVDSEDAARTFTL